MATSQINLTLTYPSKVDTLHHLKSNITWNRQIKTTKVDTKRLKEEKEIKSSESKEAKEMSNNTLLVS